MSKKNNVRAYKWPYSPLPTVFILAPMVFSFAFALDTYMPIIPDMKRILSTSEAMVQLTLSLFFLVTGFGQLVLGPLSDQFGRYRILFISVSLFFISSLMCAFSYHVSWLITFRVIQGLGACGMSVSGFAIVRDSFQGKQSAMIYSLLNAMVAISPIIGPMIGILLTTYFSWYSVFYFLAGIGFITLVLVIIFVKESLSPDNRKTCDYSILSRYLSVFKNLTFWTYTLPAISGGSAFFILFSITPYIVQELSGHRLQIGIFFSMTGGSFLIGSLISSVVVHRLGVLKTSILGCMLILCSGVLLIITYMKYSLNLYGFFCPAMLSTCGAAMTSGSGASGALEPFGEHPGTASAMFGALKLGGSSIIGSIVILLTMNTSSYPIALTMIGTSTVSLILLYHSSRKGMINRNKSDLEVKIEGGKGYRK